MIAPMTRVERIFDNRIVRLAAGISFVFAAIKIIVGLVLGDPISALVIVLLVIGVFILGAGYWKQIEPIVSRVIPALGGESATELVEHELVEIINEGQDLAGDVFSGDPGWDQISYWTGSSAQFIGAALGPRARDKLERVQAARDYRGLLLTRVDAVRQILDQLSQERVRPTPTELHELIRERRAAPADVGEWLEQQSRAPELGPTPEGIDDLMREGIELLEELSRPQEPVTDADGSVVSVTAPDDYDVERAEDFDTRARALLRSLQPAVLTDYSEAINAFYRRRRDKDDSAEEIKASDAAKMDQWFESLRLKPAVFVESCLEGLAAARKQLR